HFVCASLFLSDCAAHLDLRSFPTRRSSDLDVARLHRHGGRGDLDQLRNVHDQVPWVRVLAQVAVHPELHVDVVVVAHVQLWVNRSEEHTSELQSLAYLVCRLLLEKKKKTHT